MSGVAKFVSSQPQYSLLWREPEKEVIPLCAANGISQIVWSPLAQGVLTGKYRPGRAAAGGQPGDQRVDGRLDGPAAARRCARGGAEAEAARRGSRAQPRRNSPRLGAARAQRRLRDRRRLAARAARAKMPPPRRSVAVRTSGVDPALFAAGRIVGGSGAIVAESAAQAPRTRLAAKLPRLLLNPRCSWAPAL
jgi:hypothetical protein